MQKVESSSLFSRLGKALQIRGVFSFLKALSGLTAVIGHQIWASHWKQPSTITIALGLGILEEVADINDVRTTTPAFFKPRHRDPTRSVPGLEFPSGNGGADLNLITATERQRRTRDSCPWREAIIAKAKRSLRAPTAATWTNSCSSVLRRLSLAISVRRCAARRLTGHVNAALVSAVISWRKPSRLLQSAHRRSVTPEVAGSSPVAPAQVLPGKRQGGRRAGGATDWVAQACLVEEEDGSREHRRGVRHLSVIVLVVVRAV
jgi:hypothetical protein